MLMMYGEVDEAVKNRPADGLTVRILKLVGAIGLAVTYALICIGWYYISFIVIRNIKYFYVV